MNRDQLKIELLQKIIECNDEKLLAEVDNILKSFPSEVKEATEQYLASSPIPASHYEQLDRDYQKYKEGKIELESWAEVKERIKIEHEL
jgi:hypothetical protein